ncbi:hypothetical protein PVK06_000189 [Gossypium arboreum]|uniref:NAC domain-containing protein n=1 Tax=Gossypium arboreum TaxID=29729 RepID=A0ABR0QYJ8_GOSAR|nr:hypothetical protein PVK06_000189 [Gossypium arboreum]
MSTVRSQLQIPIGFRFLPTKEEILCDYLEYFRPRFGRVFLGYHKVEEKEQIKNRKNRGRWMLAPTICQRSEAQGRQRSHRDYEESEGEIKNNKKRKLMEVPSDSTNDVAIVPEENHTFDYMAPEVGGFSPSPPFSACLNQQPNPWTLTGVDGNLGVPEYNSHHLVPA